MKKSELRKLIQEEMKILDPLFQSPLDQLGRLHMKPTEDQEIDRFIEGLNETIRIANELKTEGPNENMDFGSLIDDTNDFIKGFQ